MNSFAPLRANLPVSRFFNSLRSRLARVSSANFPQNFRETGRINHETGGIKRETFLNLAVELSPTR